MNYQFTGGTSMTVDSRGWQITGKDAENWFKFLDNPGSSWMIDGKGGTDYLQLPAARSAVSISQPDADGFISVTMAGTVFRIKSIEYIVLSDTTYDTASGGAPAPAAPLAVNGGDGNDTLKLSSASEVVDGGVGLDTVDFSALTSSSIALSAQAGGQWRVSSTSTGTDDLKNVERLAFSDVRIALDASAQGNAGKAMAFIGMVAPQLANTLTIRGAVINYLDQGRSTADLCQFALDNDLLPRASNRELALKVFDNVLGGAPDLTTQRALESYIAEQGQVNFLQAALALHSNVHVDLVGFAATGVPYLL